MSESKSYPVDTLAQMAIIPPDRVPAFIDELPEMLEMLRRLPVINAELSGLASVIPTGLTWCDDGERHRTITATALGPDGEVLEGPLQHTVHGDFQ